MKRIVANQFRKPSGILGRVSSNMMKLENISEYDKIIPLLNIQKNDRIFEIGFGHGLGIDKIILEYDCKVDGINFSNFLFKEACKRNKKHIDNGNAELCFGDFFVSPLQQKHYNKILCSNVIYFLNTFEEPFQTISEMLKDGGIFCLYMAHPHLLKKLRNCSDYIFNAYSIEYIVEQLRICGFRYITYELEKGYAIKFIKK